MTKAISASVYFAEHAKQVKECVPVVIAHPIAKSEEYYSQNPSCWMLPVFDKKNAPEDGYVVNDYTPGLEIDHYFVTKKEMLEKSFDLADAETPCPKQDIPAGITVVPVAKGAPCPTISYMDTAPCDGFFLTGESIDDQFRTNHVICSIFNNVSNKARTDDAAVVGFRDAAVIKAITVEEKVTLIVNNERVSASAGSLLIAKPDGYAVLGKGDANIRLRVKPVTEKTPAFV